MTRKRTWALGHRILAHVQGCDRGHVSSDNVFLGSLPKETAGLLLRSVEGARRALEELAKRGFQANSGAVPPSVLIAGELWKRGRSVASWAGLLALLENYADTHDDPAGFPKLRWQATYERDDWRCMAPGCTGRRNIQDHHIHYRSKQGGNELVNQESLCAAHHLHGEHGILAHCRGRAPLGVLWRLGRTELGTWFLNERRVQPPT